MSGIEYKEDEKVLYRTKCKLGLQHRKSEEVDCLVTEEHVIIEAEEPIKIHFSKIRYCDIDTKSKLYTYSTMSWSETVLTIRDDLNKKRKIHLELRHADFNQFKNAIRRQMVGKFIKEAEERYPNKALGNFLLKIKERFRDKTRDDICAGLRRKKIDAKMAERGRVEEEIYIAKLDYSLGIIHIPEGPIRWINVRKQSVSSPAYSITVYYTEYGVPDIRLESDYPISYINSVRKKTTSKLGRVVDVHWEGDDSDLGIISSLNNNSQLKPLMNNLDVKIKAFNEYGCWLISTETVMAPHWWNSFQAIANHLLAEWPK